MRCSVAIVTFIALSLSLSPTPTSANTLIVSKWGPPVYRVLQEALDAAAPGDTIRIERGTFSETTTRFFDGKDREAVGWIDKPLTIIGTEEAWLDGPDEIDDFCLYTGQSCGLHGVQIRDTGGTGMMIWGGNSALRDCVFQDVWTGLWCVHYGTEVAVQNSTFDRFETNGVVAFAGASVGVENSHFAAHDRPGAVGRGTYAAYEARLSVSDSDFLRCGIVEVFGPSEAQVTNCSSSELKVSAMLAWNRGGRIFARDCALAGGDSIPGPIGLEVQGHGEIEADHLQLDDMYWCAIVYDDGAIQLHNSSLTNWRQDSVHLISCNNPPLKLLDFANNWWGTTDSTLIAQSIYDGRTAPIENSYGFVEFWPIRDTPLPVKRSSFGSLKSQF